MNKALDSLFWPINVFVCSSMNIIIYLCSMFDIELCIIVFLKNFILVYFLFQINFTISWLSTISIMGLYCTCRLIGGDCWFYHLETSNPGTLCISPLIQQFYVLWQSFIVFFNWADLFFVVVRIILGCFTVSSFFLCE